MSRSSYKPRKNKGNSLPMQKYHTVHSYPRPDDSLDFLIEQNQQYGGFNLFGKKKGKKLEKVEPKPEQNRKELGLGQAGNIPGDDETVYTMGPPILSESPGFSELPRDPKILPRQNPNEIFDNLPKIEVVGAFKKESGLKIDEKAIKETEALLLEIDTLYASLFEQMANILEKRRNGSPDLEQISQNYLKELDKLAKLRVSAKYMQDQMKKHIKNVYKVHPDQSLANTLITNNSKEGSSLLALAGILPNQDGVSGAIVNGHLQALKWLAESPRNIFPDQNNVNLAYAASQWDIMHWLASNPYNRRPNADKIKFPPNYLPDIESQYKMGRKLGAGAFGTVYKATDKNGKTVALKLLDPKKINRAELEQEVGLLAEISKKKCNKNVVCYYGFFPARFLGKPVMVVSMEFIDGGDMWKTFGPGETIQTRDGRNIKLTDQPLDSNLARHITDRLLKGLKHLHDMGIYHLDIKEGNVMVMKDGLEPVYVDFGLACKARIPIGPYSCDKANGGSPYYMTKRRLSCASSISDPCSEADNRQADIWALGILLLKVLSRQDLPDDADADKKFYAIADWLKKNQNNLYVNDKHINDVIKRALSDDPSVTVDELISIFTGSSGPSTQPNPPTRAIRGRTGYSNRPLPVLPEISNKLPETLPQALPQLITKPRTSIARTGPTSLELPEIPRIRGPERSFIAQSPIRARLPVSPPVPKSIVPKVNRTAGRAPPTYFG